MKKDKIIFEHLRHSKFDIDKFENVKNNTITNIKDKPIDGGLWASPINSNYSWRKVFSGMDNWEKNNSFKFSVSDDAKILCIDSLEKINLIPKKYIISYDEELFLDFEKISKDFDAIFFSPSKDDRLCKIMPHWECDSILVFNPSIIELI